MKSIDDIIRNLTVEERELHDELIEEWKPRTTPSGGVVASSAYHPPQAANHWIADPP